jgi:RNA polymerase sigma factor (sigma-70 family)
MKPTTAPTAIRRVAVKARDGEWSERSARLYEEFARPARAMLRRAFRGAFGDDELDDIYASAWVGTLRALGPKHAELSDDEVRSYLFTAVAHQAGKELRRRRRKPVAPLELAASVADHGASSPEESAATAEESRVTRDLLASLPPRRRAVILLRYGWGLEPKQICGLIKGLSPRAYRKEITRGVDQLTERIRRFERGEWCADREPVLKAYAAGLADPEQQRQAQAHLAHCRNCSNFVAKLGGHLHDLSGAVLVPAGIDGIDGHLSLGDRLLALTDRARDTAGGVIGRADGSAAQEAAATTASAGGTRGAGAAGAGILAKLAGLGTAGKLALACAGGSAALTACVATGISPLESPQPDPEKPPAETVAQADKPDDKAAVAPSPSNLPSQLQNGYSAAPAEAPQPEATKPSEGAATETSDPTQQSTTTSAAPVVESTPPTTQEFGVESAAAPAQPAPPTADTADSSSGASAGTVRQEFGP